MAAPTCDAAAAKPFGRIPEARRVVEPHAPGHGHAGALVWRAIQVCIVVRSYTW